MKLKKITKKILFIISTILFILVSGVVFYFLFIKTDYDSIWYSESWSYRKAIFLEVPNTISNIEQDLLIQVDTQKLISEGKLQNECQDLRFIDEDNSTSLRYWIEGGCNTTYTQIWVRVRIPRETQKIIYMYYGNKLAPSGQEPWNGEFISISLNDCSKGWSTVEDLKGRFPLGNSEYGQSGGELSHYHKIFESIQEENCQEKVLAASTIQDDCNPESDNILSNITTSFAYVPNYLDVNFCSSKDGYLPQNSIILSEYTTPAGWEHVSELNDKSPRGLDDLKFTSSQSHNHNSTCINAELSYTSGKIKYLSLNSVNSTNRIKIEPQYFTTNFISNRNVASIPHRAILMFTQLPPLGWEKFEDIEGRMIKGSSNNFASTGGTEDHSHITSLDFSIKNSTSQKIPNIDLEQLCLPLETNGITLLPSSNLPPYLTVIYGKKKSSGITKIQMETGESKEVRDSKTNDEQKSSEEIEISFDDEKTKEDVQKDDGEVLGAATPTTPTGLLTEGQTNPTNITDPTPEFSAIYNDPDTLDTSSFYEIEVNTASDFSGTVMWDSNKMNMTTTNQGERSPDITYLGDTLIESTTYYWRIRFWDSDDNVSPWSSTASFTLDSTPTASSLLTCGFTNPTFITNNLTFSAIYTDPGNSNATSYEIEVNTASDFTGAVMWDSGKTSTSIASENRSPDYVFNGTPLAHEGTTYYVRLRFWDGNDTPTDWATGQFVDILKGFKLDGLNLDGLKLD